MQAGRHWGIQEIPPPPSSKPNAASSVSSWMPALSASRWSCGGGSVALTPAAAAACDHPPTFEDLLRAIRCDFGHQRETVRSAAPGRARHAHRLSNDCGGRWRAPSRNFGGRPGHPDRRAAGDDRNRHGHDHYADHPPPSRPVTPSLLSVRLLHSQVPLPLCRGAAGTTRPGPGIPGGGRVAQRGGRPGGAAG